MNKFISEFKNFAVKGNAFDLAVGVIIGGAFGKIVTSIVKDLIMPLIGGLFGGFDFKNLTWKIGESEVMYGNLIQNIVDFLIIALCVFFMVKAVNTLTKKEETKKPAKPAEPAADIKLLTEIRDLLKTL